MTACVTRRAALKAGGVCKLADHDRIETGVAHQCGRGLDRFGIVAGDRHRELRIGPVRLAGEDLVVEGVEGTHQPRAGQIFLRDDADALLLDFVGEGIAVARRNCIAGIEHDLAFERRAVVAADLRQRRVRHRDEQHVAERDRLIDGAGLRKLAEAGDEVFQLVWMAR